eukprot:m.79061 g.79061  ORF g.79061 m.79061 type:complete len:170 (+) comp25176_c0_seq1:1905-2414(+)
MMKLTVLCVVGIFSGLASAHPSSLGCDNDTATKFKVGATIMFQPVAAPMHPVDFVVSKMANAAQIQVQGLPTGAYAALRTSGQMGTFTDLPMSMNFTATTTGGNCMNQVYLNTNVTSFKVVWNGASTDTTDAPTFELLWGLGYTNSPGGYKPGVHDAAVTYFQTAMMME